MENNDTNFIHLKRQYKIQTFLYMSNNNSSANINSMIHHSKLLLKKKKRQQKDQVAGQNGIGGPTIAEWKRVNLQRHT